MDAVMLLRRAHDAGLRIEPAGDKLVVKGPRRAESIVKLLAVHKAEVLAVLAQAGHAPPPVAKAGRPAAEPSFWRDCFEERAAHRQYDGGYPRIEAEQLAFGEVILEWHRRHGAPPDHHRCAGCSDALSGEVALILADGAHVHFGGIHGVKCIVSYGAKWRGAAVAALRELGLDPPDGFEL